MWTTMRVASLAPLSRLQDLRWLFLTNCRAVDRSLRPLYSLARLEVLDCAAFFPDEEFVRLRAALPRLRCDWFNLIERYGSTREGVRKELDAALRTNGCIADKDEPA